MQRFIILHTNDIHGRVAGLARIATIIEQVRNENPAIPVLYIDAGDSEETSQRLSNLTKGVAMHRLLSNAGCAASTVGNGGLMRYSFQILRDYARAACYPLLLANLHEPGGSLLDGVQSTTLLNAGSCKLGIIGLTALQVGDNQIYELFFGLRNVPSFPLLHDLVAELRQQGADTVILLSHLGLSEDRRVAEQVQGEIPLIIGAHSHNLLPQGEWNGEVLIVQTGEYAEHLGRLDLRWDDEHLQVEHVSVIPVTEDIPLSSSMQKEIETIENETEQLLNSVVGELATGLDFATDRECGVGNLLADALRERTTADVAIAAASAAFNGPLPAGPLTRLTLWESCPSSGNPTIVTMSGAQLTRVIEHGLDPAFVRETPRALRGLQRGLLHLSGASLHAGQLFVGAHPVESARMYKVVGSDWELDPAGGYIPAEWALTPTYETKTIMREVLEDYLKGKPPISVQVDRLDRS